MQFYLLFPFLSLLGRRFGWITSALIAAGGGVAVALLAGAAGLDYPMPSFLPLKLQLFLAGMLLATGADESRARLWLRLGAAMLLAAIPIGGDQALLHFAVRALLVFGFFALVYLRSLGATGRVAWRESVCPYV